jgi:hypothetical protein
MIAYRIEQESTRTNIITSDIFDVWDAIEKVTDGTPVKITTKELSVNEYEDEARLLATLNMSMKEIPG